jgi:hypothetical protein
MGVHAAQHREVRFERHDSALFIIQLWAAYSARTSIKGHQRHNPTYMHAKKKKKFIGSHRQTLPSDKKQSALSCF